MLLCICVVETTTNLYIKHNKEKEQKDQSTYILCAIINLHTFSVLLSVTQYYNITITLCLRYTEVDQTFGWARLAMCGFE